jgi:hypothetical protein
VAIPLRPHPFVQPPEVLFQSLPVLLLRDAIHPHRRILADAVVGPLQRHLIQQVRQRVEPCVRISLRSLRYLQKSRGHGGSWSVPRSCFPPEVLSRHGPPLLRWVRVPSPFPTIIARMRPSDSPVASARLRFSLGRAYQSGQASFCAPLPSPGAWPAAGPLAADGASERISGSPSPGIYQLDVQGPPRLPGHPLRPCRSRTPRRTPSQLALALQGVLPSGNPSPWASGSIVLFGAAFLRPTRSPDYASTAPSREWLQAWLPACRLRFELGGDRTHWMTHLSFGLHPRPPL